MKKLEFKFKVGDCVKWVSNHTEKEGVILCPIKPGEDPVKKGEKFSKKHKARFEYGGGRPREMKSYLVKVTKNTLSGKEKNYIYWPRVSKLQLMR